MMQNHNNAILWLPSFIGLSYVTRIEELFMQSIQMDVASEIALSANDRIARTPRFYIYTSNNLAPCWVFFQPKARGTKIPAYLLNTRFPFSPRLIMTLVVDTEGDKAEVDLQFTHINNVVNFSTLVNLPVLFVYMASNTGNLVTIDKIRKYSSNIRSWLLTAEGENISNLYIEIQKVLFAISDCKLLAPQSLPPNSIPLPNWSDIFIDTVHLGTGKEVNQKFTLALGKQLKDKGIEFNLWLSKNELDTVMRFKEFPLFINNDVNTFFYLEKSGWIYDNVISPDGNMGIDEFQKGLTGQIHKSISSNRSTDIPILMNLLIDQISM
jgi:hypothetical protein